MAGYSDRALPQKLGIKEGCRLCVFDAPPTYRSLVTLPAGATLTTKITRETDIIHIFAGRVYGEKPSEGLLTLRRIIANGRRMRAEASA